jgi:hypothetical protein
MEATYICIKYQSLAYWNKENKMEKLWSLFRKREKLSKPVLQIRPAHPSRFARPAQ